jgi:Ni/Fe-hydrogenase subunit HybB-like protein
VILSTLHQSSLGTVFLIVPQKLHPLWYSKFLPLFFFVSAIIAGFAMVIFESFLSYRFMRRELEMSILRDLARVEVVLLAVYLTMRFQDLLSRGVLGHVFDLDQESFLFLCEMGIGVVGPLVLFGLRFVRQSRTGLFVAALMVVLGLVLNRLNVAITGMAASSGVNYFPSTLEILVSIFIVSVGFVGFALISRYFPVFEPAKEEAQASSRT